MPALTSPPAPTTAPPAGAHSAQGQLAVRLLSAIDDVAAAIEALVRPLSPERRRASPPSGGWSVDEILEHLCLANADYLGVMERGLARTDAPVARGAWRASLGGWLLVRAMESERRTKAPPAIAPAPTPRPDVLAVVLASLQRLRALVVSAEAHEWRRVRLTSPYARWLRLNFGDAALVVVRHTERHARQMARTVASTEG